jgi:hypothetical protein
MQPYLGPRPLEARKNIKSAGLKNSDGAFYLSVSKEKPGDATYLSFSDVSCGPTAFDAYVFSSFFFVS